jgi:hypothetical protein
MGDHVLGPHEEDLILVTARGAVAERKRADDAPSSAALVLSGAWDDTSEVRCAILGARSLYLHLIDCGLVTRRK